MRAVLTLALTCAVAVAQAIEPQSAFATPDATSFTLLHRLASRWSVEDAGPGPWKRRGTIVDGGLAPASSDSSLSGASVQRLDVYELAIDGLERVSVGVPIVRQLVRGTRSDVAVSAQRAREWHADGLAAAGIIDASLPVCDVPAATGL